MSQEVKRGNPVEVESWRGERSTKRLKCSTQASPHIKERYKQLQDRAQQGEPVVWVYRGVPQAILNSMDIMMLDMQHYTSLLSAKQMSGYYLDKLNTEGYFRDLCRYCTVPLGYAFDRKPEIAPWGGLPKFAALVGSHTDDPALKIWELYAREFDVPMYWVDNSYPSVPLSDRFWENLREADDEVERHRVDAFVEECHGLVRFLETITGKHFSEARLREYNERVNEQSELYWKATDLACQTVPAPITISDAFSNVPAALYFLGTEYGVKNARDYYEEIKERVDKGLVAVENEKVRLYWSMGISLWFTPGFFNYWEKDGAMFVATPYMPAEGGQIRRNQSDPIRAIASLHTVYVRLQNLDPGARKNWHLHISRKYHVNGAVYLTVESCKLLYAAVRFSMEALEKAGIPTLDINADMVDARDWDDTKMKSLMTSFIETLVA